MAFFQTKSFWLVTKFWGLLLFSTLPNVCELIDNGRSLEPVNVYMQINVYTRIKGLVIKYCIIDVQKLKCYERTCMSMKVVN